MDHLVSHDATRCAVVFNFRRAKMCFMRDQCVGESRVSSAIVHLSVKVKGFLFDSLVLQHCCREIAPVSN